MKFISEALSRLKSDTPAFFNKIKVIGGGIAGVGMALLAINNNPPILNTIAEHMVWIGSVAAAISQFAVKTPNQNEK